MHVAQSKEEGGLELLAPPKTVRIPKSTVTDCDGHCDALGSGWLLWINHSGPPVDFRPGGTTKVGQQREK